MKATGTTHWIDPNTGATNETGFSALPGGNRSSDGSFYNMGYSTNFFSATEYDATYAWRRNLDYSNAEVFRGYDSRDDGFSVRCVKGEGSTIVAPTVTTNAATSVGETSATLNGNVTSNGGAAVSDKGFYYSTSTDPASSGTKISEGTGTGSYSSALTALASGETYYFVAYATNIEGTSYGEVLSFTTDRPDITGQTGTLSDYDGNTYNWIGIGKQAWMAENLKTTRYADGSAIPHVEGTTEWDNLTVTDKAYCWYNNSTANRDTYGGLYTWAAAMNGAASSDANPSGVQGVCPDGWHLPSDAEWKELEMFLGMSQAEADDTGWRGTDEGGKLKEAGTTHWNSPNTGATNESGFTALPGGCRGLRWLVRLRWATTPTSGRPRRTTRRTPGAGTWATTTRMCTGTTTTTTGSRSAACGMIKHPFSKNRAYRREVLKKTKFRFEIACKLFFHTFRGRRKFVKIPV